VYSGRYHGKVKQIAVVDWKRRGNFDRIGRVRGKTQTRDARDVVVVRHAALQLPLTIRNAPGTPV
jgi:hypothetical protein